MSKILNKLSVLKAVAEEKLGFKFGSPERLSEQAMTAVLPILRETTTKRQYITYPETDQLLATDSGSINRMNLKNTSKENIFLRSGTIFIGKTQERALTRSTVVFPGQEVSLDVRCVHASKGIHVGAEVKYGGVTPLAMDMKTYGDGYRAESQNTYWSTVQDFSDSIGNKRSTDGEAFRGVCDLMGNRLHTFRSDVADNMCFAASSVTHEETKGIDPVPPNVNINIGGVFSAAADDLASNMNDFAKSFDDILSQIKLHDKQVGFGLINTEGCQTIELFDVDQSWAAFHKDAVRRVGDKLGNKEPQPFEFKEQTAVENVRWVLSQEFKINTIFEHKPTNGEPSLEISGLTSSSFIGEIVELDGKVIHLVIIRKQK
jgi:hypothetical protein